VPDDIRYGGQAVHLYGRDKTETNEVPMERHRGSIANFSRPLNGKSIEINDRVIFSPDKYSLGLPVIMGIQPAMYIHRGRLKVLFRVSRLTIVVLPDFVLPLFTNLLLCQRKGSIRSDISN